MKQPILLADDSTLNVFQNKLILSFFVVSGVLHISVWSSWLCKFWDSFKGQSFSFFARRCILHAHSMLKPERASSGNRVPFADIKHAGIKSFPLKVTHLIYYSNRKALFWCIHFPLTVCCCFFWDTLKRYIKKYNWSSEFCPITIFGPLGLSMITEWNLMMYSDALPMWTKKRKLL